MDTVSASHTHGVICLCDYEKRTRGLHEKTVTAQSFEFSFFVSRTVQYPIPAQIIEHVARATRSSAKALADEYLIRFRLSVTTHETFGSCRNGQPS